MAPLASDLAAIDNQLSKRFIHLDPAGYFIIFVDHAAGLIGVKHYTNDINDKGLAVDPETGKPFPVRGTIERTPIQTFTGRTAKEVGIALTEKADPCPLTKLDHALYLGRELVRAEIALIKGVEYVQD
jgi:dihydropteroate synthase